MFGVNRPVARDRAFGFRLFSRVFERLRPRSFQMRSDNMQLDNSEKQARLALIAL
jgi:hypothetical protein